MPENNTAMEVVEAYFDNDKQRSLEIYEDDDGLFRFEEWSAGGGSVSATSAFAARAQPSSPSPHSA